jgi:hypothetical protein
MCPHFGPVTHEDEVLGLCRLYGCTLAVISWPSGMVDVSRCHACREGERLAKAIRVTEKSAEIDETKGHVGTKERIMEMGAEKVPPTRADREEEQRAQDEYEDAVRQDWRKMNTADLMLAWREAMQNTIRGLRLPWLSERPPKYHQEAILEEFRAIKEHKPVLEMEHVMFAGDVGGGVQQRSDGQIFCDGLINGEDFRCCLRGQTADSTETWEQCVGEVLAYLHMDPAHENVNTPGKARRYILEAIRAIQEHVPVVDVVGCSPKG